jgi:hypothetical protein
LELQGAAEGVPMSQEKKPTQLDELKRKILDNRFMAVMILVGIMVVSLAAFTNAVSDIGDFFQSIFASKTPTATTVPVQYYAVFGLQFPEGAWRENETYSYSLELRECAEDNFTGSVVTFTVQRGLADRPFYLLRDGVFDRPDRNDARPANASPLYPSYAVIIIPKSAPEAAQQVVSACKAYINIQGAPQLALQPSGLEPILVLEDFNPDVFPDAGIDAVPK